MMNKFTFVLALAGAAATFPTSAIAQSYPLKPIRFVVPFAPGGGSDVVARIISLELAKSLGQQLIIDIEDLSVSQRLATKFAIEGDEIVIADV